MYIAIIDYKLSNMFSIKHALDHLGYSSVITSNPKIVMESDAAILPGVGAFSDAMKNLNSLGLSKAIRKYVLIGKPFMGVCLGMQLLCTESEEFGNHKGLNIISGLVKKIPTVDKNNKPVPVPQIGWNKISKNKMKWLRTALADIPNGSYMYFIHSYIVIPSDTNMILSTTNYFENIYCSSIRSKNITAVQFHPEKSGQNGLKIYYNFIKNNI